NPSPKSKRAGARGKVAFPHKHPRACAWGSDWLILTLMPDSPPTNSNAAATGPGRLELRGVSKQFRAGQTHALGTLDLVCAPGEFVVVVGPSGCGKSTLLNIAAGLMPPDSGAVVLDGRRVSAPGPDRAMVFQEHGLFPWLTAAANVDFGLKMRGMARR